MCGDYIIQLDVLKNFHNKILENCMSGELSLVSYFVVIGKLLK